MTLGCAIPFGLVFIVVGCGILWMMILRPLAQVAASLRWQPVEAVVVSSSLHSERGDDGDTYRVAIRYRYDWPPPHVSVEAGPPAVLGAAPATPGGATRAYESDRYNFSSGHTNVAVHEMRAVVAAHPPGARVVCYVDPTQPESAVIDRSPPLHVWLGFGFAIFPLAGVGVIGFAWHARRKALSGLPLRPDGTPVETNDATTVKPGQARDPSSSGGILKLAPSEGRASTFLGVGFITLFWNGIVSVFVIIAIKEFGQGFMGWFLPVFLIPFVAVGAVLLAAFIHSLARLFTPPAHLWLETVPPRLGSPAIVRWELRGHGVRRLRVSLHVYEEATYTVGTNSTTDRVELVRETLFDSTDALALRQGRLSIALPGDALPPAFHARHNRLAWELAFHGDIPRRADLDDRFLLPVAAPAALTPALADATPVAHPGDGLTLWTAENFAPGDTLVFTVARDTHAAPGPLTARLGWFTEGRGSADSAIVWSTPLPDLAPGADHTLETKLPLAPWSFSGALVSVEWRLEIVDRKNRPLAHARLVVSPGGEPLTLRPALPDEPKDKTPWWRRFPLNKST